MASTSASIQRTLNLIVPTATTLPPSLIDLATNLLAQSRAKAPSLKPDEEIARPFACCHIACERLKNRLALEIGKVGPPCGPRIYKRLYAFLDSSLAAEPSTPRTKRVQDVAATPASGRSGRLAAAVKATPGSMGKRSRAAAGQDSGASDLPGFTMPLVRHVCEADELPKGAMHVYTGVETVYRELQNAAQSAEMRGAGTPSKRTKSNEGDVGAGTSDVLPVPTEEQVPALIVAVYLMVAQALRGQDGLSATKAQQKKAQTAVQTYFSIQENDTITITPRTLSKDTETYLQAAKAGWTDMDWYKNLPSAQDIDTNDPDHTASSATPRNPPAKTPLRRKEKHSQPKIGGQEENPAGLLPGLGTMFQPAVDWLSEERKADFEIWKEEVLGSVVRLEQEV